MYMGFSDFLMNVGISHRQDYHSLVQPLTCSTVLTSYNYKCKLLTLVQTFNNNYPAYSFSLYTMYDSFSFYVIVYVIYNISVNIFPHAVIKKFDRTKEK